MREIRHLVFVLRSPLPWAALVLSLLLGALAYQRPFSYTLDLGNPSSSLYITNFYPPQQIEGRSARWSHAYSYVRLLGIGGDRALRVTVEFNPLRSGVSNPPPVHLVALAGGEELYNRTFQGNPGWQTMTLDIDASHPEAFASRDLVIEMRTDVYRPPDYQGNELGVLVSRVAVAPLPGAPWSLVIPTLRVMLLLGALVLVIYLLASRVVVGVRGQGSGVGVRQMAAAVATGMGVAAAVALFVDPVWLAANLQTIVLFFIVAYLALVVGIYLLPRLWPSIVAELRAIHVALSYRPLVGFVVLAPIAFSAAFQAPLSYSIDIGSGHDEPFISGFNQPLFPLPGGAPGDYRTTSARAFVTVPGVGSGNSFSVTLRLARGDVPGGPVRVLANGSQVAQLSLSPGWQDVTVRAESGPAQLFSPSNLNMEIISPAQLVEGGQQQGILVDRISIEQTGSSGSFSTSPAHEAGLILGLFLLYLLLARAGGLSPSLATKRLAMLACVAALLVVTWALFAHRVEVTLALPHLLVTLALSYLLLAISTHFFSRMFGAYSALTLASLFVVAFMLRFGISALPQVIVVDLPYHLKWLRTLISGDFLALYLPGELSSVPPEWSLNVLIPKSPLFYIAMWPLGLLKGLDLGPAVLCVVSLLDACQVPAVYALVRRVEQRAALWAALLYAIMPLAFRAFAYGVLPTIFAQALALFVMLVPALWPDSLRKPLWLAGWVVLLAASLVAFPTTLAFNGMVIVFVAFAWRWRKAAPPATTPLLLGGLVAAVVLAFASYYGLYVQPILTQTLPALGQGVTVRGKELWPGGLPDLLGWTADYVIGWILWLLLPFGLWLLWQGRRPYTGRLAMLMLAWLGIFLLGLLLNLRIDMIGKHLYYTMPAAAIAAGLILSRLWSLRSSPYARVLAVFLAVSVAWSALVFVAGRI